MAKDYKNIKSAGHQSPKQIPGWLWLFTGLLIGVFMAFLVYLQSDGKNDAKVEAVQGEKATGSLHWTQQNRLKKNPWQRGSMSILILNFIKC